MHCYLSCLSPDKHSKLSHHIYCPIALLCLGTVRLVTSSFLVKNKLLSVCSQTITCRQFKTPILSTEHILQMHLCYSSGLVSGNCSIPVNKCLVIWYFYKSLNAEVTASYPFISSYQNRVESTAPLWLTSCRVRWFNRNAFTLNHYMLAQSILAWLKACHRPHKYIFARVEFLQELGAVILRLSNELRTWESSGVCSAIVSFDPLMLSLSYKLIPNLNLPFP